MLALRRRLIARLAVAAILLSAGASLSGQATQSASEYPDSRVDIYGGYGYFHPINSGVGLKQYFDVDNLNGTISVAGYFNRYVGVAIEAGYFSGVREHAVYDPNCIGEECSQLVYTAEAGPVFRVPLGPWIPFVHALGGGVRNNGPVDQPLTWGWGVSGGAGLDYTVPFFRRHVAVRIIQADWQYSQVVYGPLVLPEAAKGGFGEVDALKLSGGVVIKLGEIGASKALDVGCTVNPAVGHPGDIITVTAASVNFDPKRPAAYTWKTNGGRITPAGAEATIDTTGLAPGEYVASAHVVQGMKARQQSSCMTPFTIKPFEPPTLTCSATPATATAGTTIDISTTGTSPQNRPLTYSYSASAGQLTSEGPTAKLSTAGLGATTITVTCNVVDDLGQTAQSNTQVTLTVPPTPTVAETQDLCHISFDRDRRRPVRVDNEAKACLDDVALTMQQQPGAKLVMVGNSSARENPEAGAERALNARQYLVQEKGIDKSRVEVRVGETPGQYVSNTLVPPGAHFDGSTSRAFDEETITRHGQAYGTGFGGQYQPRRSTPRPRRNSSPRKPPLNAAPAEKSGASNSPGVSTPAPSANPKNRQHAKPSPATPLTPQARQGNSAGKPSPATPLPTNGSKPSALSNQTNRNTAPGAKPVKTASVRQTQAKTNGSAPPLSGQAKNSKPSPETPLVQASKHS
jgi:outer membrane protein OmpA-like peptidoglycan-associated protein